MLNDYGRSRGDTSRHMDRATSYRSSGEVPNVTKRVGCARSGVTQNSTTHELPALNSYRVAVYGLARSDGATQYTELNR